VLLSVRRFDPEPRLVKNGDKRACSTERSLDAALALIDAGRGAA
jgi:hypothetical protein